MDAVRLAFIQEADNCALLSITVRGNCAEFKLDRVLDAKAVRRAIHLYFTPESMFAGA